MLQLRAHIACEMLEEGVDGLFLNGFQQLMEPAFQVLFKRKFRHK